MKRGIERSRIKSIYFILFALVVVVGCVKSNIPYVPPVDMNFTWETTHKVSVSVPVTIADISADAGKSVNAVKSNPYATTIKIYSSPLFTESSLIASGAAYNGTPFESFMDLPLGKDEVYVKLITPEGLVSLSTYSITGSKAVLKSDTGAAYGVSASTKAGESTPTIPVPYFPSTYDVTIHSSNDLPSVFTGNRTYYIPSGVNVNTNNSAIFANSAQQTSPVVYVAGSFTLNSSKEIALTNCTIVVLQGGEVNLKGKLNIKQPSSTLAFYVQEGGEAWLKGADIASGTTCFVNEGKTWMAGDCNVKNGALFYNTGVFEIVGDKDLSLDGHSGLYNTATILVDNIELEDNAVLYNYDQARISCGNLEMKGHNTYMYQHGYIEVEDETEIEGRVDNYGSFVTDELSGENAQLYNYRGALTKMKTLEESTNFKIYLESGSITYIYEYTNNDGDKHNTGVQFINANRNPLSDFALVMWGVSDGHKDRDINLNSKGEVSFDGNIENYCPKKNESQCQKYTENFCSNNAYWTKVREHYIPESDYNEGLGKDPDTEITDADGDGVPGNEDIDDHDPDVAYVSYFPSKEVWGTYFYEDLYPWIGDYDMNDIVLGFRIAYYTNAAGLVSYIDYNWRLNAVGSTMGIACGVQLDEIAASAVQSISNTNTALKTVPIGGGATGLEPQQSKAVFALFNSPDELYRVSTSINVFSDPGAYSAIPLEQNVRIRFNTKQNKASLSVDRINTFIVVGDLGKVQRDKEVHLSTFSKTDLGGTSYYSQGYVSSQNPYKATNGMVWGYMVPVAFRYPIEMCNITAAYPRFQDWYESAGNNYQQWYDVSDPDNNVKTEYLY